MQASDLWTDQTAQVSRISSSVMQADVSPSHTMQVEGSLADTVMHTVALPLMQSAPMQGEHLRPRTPVGVPLSQVDSHRPTPGGRSPTLVSGQKSVASVDVQSRAANVDCGIRFRNGIVHSQNLLGPQVWPHLVPTFRVPQVRRQFMLTFRKPRMWRQNCARCSPR